MLLSCSNKISNVWQEEVLSNLLERYCFFKFSEKHLDKSSIVPEPHLSLVCDRTLTFWRLIVEDAQQY